MRRGLVFALVVLMVCQALSVTAFASVGDGGFFDGFWDNIGGMFSGLMEMFASVGTWIVETIGNAVTALLDGLKYLFIPKEGYFQQAWQRIYNKLGEKFGGLLSVFKYLSTRFGNLRAYPGLNDSFTIQFPSGHLLGGIRINLIEDASGVIDMVRGAFSGFVVLMTAAFCYRKIVAQLNS